MSKDEAHVPYTELEMNGASWNRFDITISIIKHITIGWPAYLLANALSNRQDKTKKITNHFSPWSSLFNNNQVPYVILNDLAIASWIFLLCSFCYIWGFSIVLKLYLLPYLVNNAWLVIVTKMQHSAVDIPHYSDLKYTWVKGQLCTVDRDFGWILNMYFFSSLFFFNWIQINTSH